MNSSSVAALAIVAAVSLAGCGAGESATAEDRGSADRSAAGGQDLRFEAQNAAIALEATYVDTGSYPDDLAAAEAVMGLPDGTVLGAYELLDEGDGYRFCLASAIESVAAVYDTDVGLSPDEPTSCS